MKLLIKVNYTETKTHRLLAQHYYVQRGESLHSYRSWSVIFHWSTGKTYRFIQQLNAKGIIEIIPHDAATFLHIRVVNYESWTNALRIQPRQTTEKSQRRKVPPLLGRLPQHHAAPQREHRQGAAYLEKAERKEQQLAIDNIEEYYYHQTNVKFTLHACSYLSNKAFLNEYEY